jgi:hypothetical protein
MGLATKQLISVLRIRLATGHDGELGTDAWLANLSDRIPSTSKSLDDLFCHALAVTLVIAVVAPVEILANDLGGDDLDDLVDLIVHGARSHNSNISHVRKMRTSPQQPYRKLGLLNRTDRELFQPW